MRTLLSVLCALGALVASAPVDASASLRYATLLGDTNTRVADVAVNGDGALYVAGRTGNRDFPTTPGAFDEGDALNALGGFVAKFEPGGGALEYATGLGADRTLDVTGLALDGDGNAYVTGFTDGSGFPTTDGAFDRTIDPQSVDAFVAKLSADGSELLYGTYLGGTPHRPYDGLVGSDFGQAIAVDSSGAAHVTGVTQAIDFPTTPDAIDRTADGIIPQNAFVTKLSPDGSALEYSTYLPGSSHDWGFGVAVDRDGNAVVTGHTSSSDFLTTPGALDRSANFAFDVFVTKLDPAGAALYSTYLGGGGSEGGAAVDVDRHGNAYVTGRTIVHESWNAETFPTTPGSYDTTPDVTGSEFNGDMFLAKLPPDGSRLEYSTALGDVGEEFARGVAVDRQGRAHVFGMSEGRGFPVTAGAHDTTHNGGFDAVVARFSADGARLTYSTFLGGAADEGFLGEDGGIALDRHGRAHVGMPTFSHDFPVTPDAFQSTFAGTGFAGFHAIVEIPRRPALVRIGPPTASRPVGSQHCVTARVADEFGDALDGVAVTFTVTGSNPTSATVTSDDDGDALLCYRGDLHGTDTVEAAVASAPGVASGQAAVHWTVASDCAARAKGNGAIEVAGRIARFHVSARRTGAVLKGFLRYADGARRVSLRTTGLEAITCAGPQRASLFGYASGHPVRADLADGGKAATATDTLRVRTPDYDSGERPLNRGSLRIR